MSKPVFTPEQEDRINEMIFEFLSHRVRLGAVSQVPDGYVGVPVSESQSEGLLIQSREQLQAIESRRTDRLP